MLYKEIDTVEFDLNTVCNSYCPPCHRYTVQNGELFHNPYVKLGVNLELDVIERVFTNSRITDDVCVDLVGLVGEPIAHPQFMEIIDIIYKHRPKATINLHTNGGLRTEKMFYDLGKKFNKHSWIKFSLDGLEDTNGIYRIGVDYNKVVANMRAFIDGGGRAIWKFVTFKWNEHQVEQAKALADEYGCEKPAVAAEDAAQLLQASWEGNIRQLINLAERTVLQSRRGSYSITEMLPSNENDDENNEKAIAKPLKEHVEAFERMLIDNTMRRHKGSIQSVMAELSLPRRTLNEKMAKYGLTRSNYVGS